MFGGSFLGGVPVRGMGQAQIRQGSGFVGPFGIYSDVGAPQGYGPPPGFPAVTQEEIQTYICPDGSRQSLTREEAMEQGCVPAPPTGPRAVGPPPLMAGRQGAFLGQVNLVTGPATTPFYAYPPSGYFVNPSGNPLMTPEITSPQEEHIAREYHCYTKEGQYRSAPFALRDAMKAEGWEETDYRFCSSPPLHAQPVGTPVAPVLMGQNGAPGGGPSGGQGQGGAGTPSGQPSGTSFARQFGPTDGFGFPAFAFPTFPGYYPPPAPSGRMTCKRIVNEDTGEERFECVPREPVAPYRYPTYPTYFMNPLFL